LGITPFWQDL